MKIFPVILIYLVFIKSIQHLHQLEISINHGILTLGTMIVLFIYVFLEFPTALFLYEIIFKRTIPIPPSHF